MEDENDEKSNSIAPAVVPFVPEDDATGEINKPAKKIVEKGISLIFKYNYY